MGQRTTFYTVASVLDGDNQMSVDVVVACANAALVGVLGCNGSYVSDDGTQVSIVNYDFHHFIMVLNDIFHVGFLEIIPCILAMGIKYGSDVCGLRLKLNHLGIKA